MTRIAVLIFIIVILFWWLVRNLSSGRRSPRHERRRRQAEATGALLAGGTMAPEQAFAYLRKISPYAFEELVLDGFERKGYEVTRNCRYSGDGGIDGRVSIDGKEYLVQCKRYRGYISRSDVEDFSRVCKRESKRGYFVHTGRTGEGAWEVAGEYDNVKIISGDRMLSLIGYKKFFRN